MTRKNNDNIANMPIDKANEFEGLIHFGGLIKERLVLEGRSIRWFALQMNCDRSNMYKLLARPHLDTNFILRACKILEYDFFKDASEVLKKVML